MSVRHGIPPRLRLAAWMAGAAWLAAGIAGVILSSLGLMLASTAIALVLAVEAYRTTARLALPASIAATTILLWVNYVLVGHGFFLFFLFLPLAFSLPAWPRRRGPGGPEERRFGHET
jgi:hypothetical protein